MDNYDKSILKQLQNEGRMSNLSLSEKIHLSAPQTMRRVRSLEESKVIRRYTAQITPASIGLNVTAFVSLSLDREQFRNVREVERNIMAFEDVIECHTISGDFDYLLKVVANDLKALSLFLTDRLLQISGIASLRSMICMEEIKPPSELPIR